MNNTILVIGVLIVAIGGIGAVAYFLEKRGKKSKPVATDLPELGPKGKVLLWIARILVVLMVLSVIGFFVFRSRSFLWVTGISLGLFAIYGFIFRIIRLLGK